MASRRPSSALAQRAPLLLVGAAMAGLVATSLPAAGQAPPPAPFQGQAAFEEYGFQGEGEARVQDVDARTGAVAPTAGQLALAERLGATGARWNDFGTPHVLINHRGALSAPRAGEPAAVARDFVRDNAELFRLDAGRVDALALVKDVPLYDSPDIARVYRGELGAPDHAAALNQDVGHVVTFEQRFEGLEPALGGQLTVAVKADGSVAYLTSSLTGDGALSGAQQLSAADAITAAAADPEVGLDVGTLTPTAPSAGLETFTSDTITEVQRAGQVALVTPTDGVRRVWGVALLDSALDEHGNPTGFVSYVDAETGRIWHRTNRVEHFAQGGGAATVSLPQTGAPVSMQAAPTGGPVTGNTGDDGTCGIPTEFEVPAGTGEITVTVASPENPNGETVNADLVAQILFQGKPVVTGDSLGNPEVATYSPPAETLPGTYAGRACNFSPDDPGFSYTGAFALTPLAVPEPGGPEGNVQLPTWKVFPANPPFVQGKLPENVDSTKQDTRVLWCWDIRRKEGCQEEQRNSASRVPWDVNAPNLPSFTTDGNNASTAVSQASFLTPDSLANRPVSATREYEYPWENSWFENSCDPSNFGTVADDRNDEQASTTNLFVQHNRMHDWSYFLGFTEVNSNLQKNNFGNTGEEFANDPELGSSQAGRTTANGRDNANQITLGDGIAPITNQYLWQPLAGAFYAPCVDGAYDQAVVAHEYGHAITNRMIGGEDGPFGGTGRTQGQTESWSDLQFAAYFTEFAISAGKGVNPYVLGPYVTGNEESGIRNYAMNNSPLNYSDLDYDPNGLSSPHANGEIWSATNFDILTALNAKYDRSFPSSDVALQNSCARGQKAAEDCPGNRRWNQIQYDSYLIQPSGASMVDSRDGMLAADMLRFDGANQDELWDVFAKRGLGEGATSTGPDDVESTPGFDSPLREDEAQVTFVAPDGVKDMEVFVGQHEARAVPVADTVKKSEVTATAALLPSTYTFIATAPGAGAQRFTLELGSGEQRRVEVPLRRNLASASNGGKITGDGVNLERLIDDTEETNWASLESEGTASEGKEEGAQVEGRQVTVDLAGSSPVDVEQVQVSALLRGPANTEEDEDLPDPDQGSQSRFSALRSFDILACDSDCDEAKSFTKIFSSDDDAFPGIRPRPTISKLNARLFDVEDTKATHLRLVVRDNQCTGGPDYQRETNPDNDENFTPDCDTLEFSPDREAPLGPGGLGAPRPLDPPFDLVRAAEFQVFSTTAESNPTLPAPGTPEAEGPEAEQPDAEEPDAEEPEAEQPGAEQPQQPDSPQGSQDVSAQAREIFDACPENEVPRNSRDDDNGNTHEFAIDCMVWYEIAKGTSDTKYDPITSVTRAQMASFIARLVERSGGQFPANPQDAFSDDENATPHEQSIDKLAAANIVDGKGDGTYDPLGAVTRGQMAKFLVNAYQYRSGNALAARGDYFDDDNGTTHEADINRSAEGGFTAGLQNGEYGAGRPVPRDQMASFLARVLDLLVEEGTAQSKSSQG